MPDEEREKMEPLLNTEEAARLLGISKRTVEKWILEKRIPYVKLGTRGRGAVVRFRPDTLRAWIAAQEIPASAPGPGASGKVEAP